MAIFGPKCAIFGPSPELIFVTNITNYISGNLFFGNVGKFSEILGDFAIIYALSCGGKLSPKSTFVEKKDKYEAGHPQS